MWADVALNQSAIFKTRCNHAAPVCTGGYNLNGIATNTHAAADVAFVNPVVGQAGRFSNEF
tara:strand:- start:83 stop:265 length:183 start_codon:yes stop_codon:yes gene_type:complete